MLTTARRQRGLTLVELMVTLAIMAMLMFAVVPDISGIMANAKLRSAVEATSAGLQRARMEAMRTNVNVTFWLASSNTDFMLDDGCGLAADATSWVVSVGDPSGRCSLSASDVDLPLIKFKHHGSESMRNIAVSGTAADRATAATSVAFDGFGRVSTGALRYLDFTMTHSEARALRIEMTASGVVRVCEPAIAIASTDPRRCLYS